jgi:RNA polymerase sigma-70 factor (ECF subfamily)
MQYPLSVDSKMDPIAEPSLHPSVVPASSDGLLLPEIVLPAGSSASPPMAPVLHFAGPPPLLLEELWKRARGSACGLTRDEFGQALAGVGAKVNHGLPPGTAADPNQRASFFRGLRLEEFALAQGCALGRDAAWEQFFRLYRSSLTQAAIGITGSATLGNDLADSLYAELYGLRQVEGERRSPLASYSGRGSLMGWLRTTLVQRFRDHHRRTHREEPLEDLDMGLDTGLHAPTAQPEEPAAETAALAAAVRRSLKALGAEDRFLLIAYYLDRQTLLQIARTLGVHEATISRRLKRLLADARNLLLENLCAGGLSAAAAAETLGADPRDLEINLRALLQHSQSAAFSDERAGGDAGAGSPASTAGPD